MPREKITLLDLQKKRDRHQPIVMVTAYDYPSAILADNAEVDIMLVGDSLGMVVHGFESTVPVTMEMMVLHCAAVMRAKPSAFVVGDLPFGSYEVSVEAGVRNAFRLMKEGSVDAVKLEGGAERAPVIRAIVDAGIAVQGHIGLTPQSVSKLGGFKAQGRTATAARDLLHDALALQAAGCFSIVLEAVPERVATYITEQLTIPTVGIGAGAKCNGQVLVWHDMLGLFARFQPKFTKQYTDVGTAITDALKVFADEVRTGQFPAREHVFSIKEEEWNAFVVSVTEKGVEEDGV